MLVLLLKNDLSKTTKNHQNPFSPLPNYTSFLFDFICSWLLWFNTILIFIFSFYSFIFLTIFNHKWAGVCCVTEVAPSFLPITLILIFYFILLYFLFIHNPTLTYTTFLFTHWSRGFSSVEWEPIFWDSINQHQQKPQRLLVKLLTNILNTKRLISLLLLPFVLVFGLLILFFTLFG